MRGLNRACFVVVLGFPAGSRAEDRLWHLDCLALNWRHNFTKPSLQYTSLLPRGHADLTDGEGARPSGPVAQDYPSHVNFGIWQLQRGLSRWRTAPSEGEGECREAVGVLSKMVGEYPRVANLRVQHDVDDPTEIYPGKADGLV